MRLHFVKDRHHKLFFFFFNDTATTEIYTLSLHDALPISHAGRIAGPRVRWPGRRCWRSEEHTSELQSHSDLVCRLLLEKKNDYPYSHINLDNFIGDKFTRNQASISREPIMDTNLPFALRT